MRRRVPLQKLRGSDPTLLEVQIQDLLSRPSGAIEPENLCDLFALGELESPPKAITGALKAFLDRAKGELAEVADGSQMKDFKEDFGAIPAVKVPASFRAYLKELCGRESRDSEVFEELLALWADTEPEPFELGAGATKVQKVEAGKPPKPAPRHKGVGGKVEDEPAKKKRAPKKTKAQTMDVDKHKWISDCALERLGGSMTNGLGEHVMLAGIRHLAREEYPNMAVHEITAVLNDLLKKGRVRKSAGRWYRMR